VEKEEQLAIGNGQLANDVASGIKICNMQ